MGKTDEVSRAPATPPSPLLAPSLPFPLPFPPFPPLLCPAHACFSPFSTPTHTRKKTRVGGYTRVWVGFGGNISPAGEISPSPRRDRCSIPSLRIVYIVISRVIATRRRCTRLRAPRASREVAADASVSIRYRIPSNTVCCSSFSIAYLARSGGSLQALGPNQPICSICPTCKWGCDAEPLLTCTAGGPRGENGQGGPRERAVKSHVCSSALHARSWHARTFMRACSCACMLHSTHVVPPGWAGADTT